MFVGSVKSAHGGSVKAEKKLLFFEEQDYEPSIWELIVAAFCHYRYLLWSIPGAYVALGVIRAIGMVSNPRSSITYWSLLDWWWAPIVTWLARLFN